METLTITLSVIAVILFFIFVRYTIYKDYISQRETHQQIQQLTRQYIQQNENGRRHSISVPPRYEDACEDDTLTRSRPPSYESRIFNNQNNQNLETIEQRSTSQHSNDSQEIIRYQNNTSYISSILSL
jgi:hypothetical protein